MVTIEEFDDQTRARSNSAARQVAALIRYERERRFLTQERLAELSGVDSRRISAYERRERQPRLDDAERVLAGMGLQLRLETEALSSDIDARLDELLALSTVERIARLRVALPELLDWLAPGEPVVEGTVAAIIQGAPIDATMLALSVARERLDDFATAMMRFPPARWNERWQDYGVSSSDPRQPGPMRWRSHFGEFTLRVADSLSEFLTVRIDETELRVRPLSHVEIDDPAVSEQLRRFRERHRPAL